MAIRHVFDRAPGPAASLQNHYGIGSGKPQVAIAVMRMWYNPDGITVVMKGKVCHELSEMWCIHAGGRQVLQYMRVRHKERGIGCSAATGFPAAAV